MKVPFPWFGNPLLESLEHEDYALGWAIKLAIHGVLRVMEDGCIWRYKYKNHGRWKDCVPRRAENPSRKGYLRVTLTSPRGPVQTMAHKLVWAWFHGPIPKEQINHKDLVRSHNSPDNLEPVTQAENIQHSYAHGRTRPWAQVRKHSGEWRGKPVLTDGQIGRIRAARDAGAFLKDIGREFNISTTHAHRLTAYREKKIA